MDTPEEKIHHFQQILKSDPENKEACLGLGIALDLKSEKDKEPVFLVSAMSRFRQVIKLDPANESAHDHLICSVAKKGVLDELAREYREKLNQNPNNPIFKNCLKKISVLSSFSIITPVRLVNYKPSRIFKIFFDYILLPSTGLLCCFSLMGPREFSGAFLELALGMFVLYIIYKWLTFQ